MNGVVVAPQPPAAEAGADVLRSGGNAFDAAVAAAFVQAATDPFMCGIGGIGIAQLFDAATGENVVIDFVGRVGSRAQPDQWAKLARRTAEGKTYVQGWHNYLGYQAILIPGTVAGLAAIHAGRGRMPWRELLQPAIRILREGFPLYEYMTEYFFETHQYPVGENYPTFDAFIHATDAMARLWLHEDGTVRQVGEHLTNPDYAAVLECLADDGPDAFYRGAIAERIMADFAAHDALITADDLAGQQAFIRAPLRSDYRGATVATSPLGGATVLQILTILEGFPVAAMGHNSADYLHTLASTMQLVFPDREQMTSDGGEATMEWLVSKEHAAALRARINAASIPAEEMASVPGTTHLSVADRNGNAVALTHTLSTGGGVVTPGLGFQYNNGMSSFDPLPGKPRSIAAGKARITPMAPTLVFRAGRPAIILGSPGSNAIVNAIAQVIVNVVDFGMTPIEAVSAPRIHCEGGPVLTETRLPIATGSVLAARGHRLKPRPFAYDSLQGRVQLIVASENGWVGASDPRRDGGVAIYA
ncbi:MAG: gamma-glutamyltransferase family protein [Thermomicrobiales bacterium]